MGLVARVVVKDVGETFNFLVERFAGIVEPVARGLRTHFERPGQRDHDVIAQEINRIALLLRSAANARGEDSLENLEHAGYQGPLHFNNLRRTICDAPFDPKLVVASGDFRCDSRIFGELCQSGPRGECHSGGCRGVGLPATADQDLWRLSDGIAALRRRGSRDQTAFTVRDQDDSGPSSSLHR